MQSYSYPRTFSFGINFKQNIIYINNLSVKDNLLIPRAKNRRGEELIDMLHLNSTYLEVLFAVVIIIFFAIALIIELRVLLKNNDS